VNLINKTFVTITDKIKGDSLKARGARGVVTLGIGTVAERGLRLVRNMILARLLAPDDFGLMAIIIAISTLFEVFSDIGVRQSVIHNKKGAEYEYLNMVWWLQTVRSLVLFAIMFLIAPSISSFYGKPELTLFLRIAFVAGIFHGVISPRVHALQKELRFGRWVFISQGAGFLGTVFAIGSAFWFRNTWALVIGFTAEALSRCLLSFILCPFWPRFRIDWNSSKELLRYVRGMVGLSFLTIVYMQADVFVLGKLMPTKQVGMYVLALALARQPTGMFSRVIGDVLLPVFAEKQDDKQSLCRAALKMIRTTVVLGIPLVAIAAIFAGSILSVVYGPKYAAVAVPFGILCAAQLFRIQKTILGVTYLALGKQHLHRRFVLIMVTIILIAMYPGVKFFGLVGAACVLLLADVIGLSMHVVGMQGLIGLRFRDYASCCLPCVWLLPIMLWPIVVLRLMGETSGWMEAMVAILGLLISYLIYFKPRFIYRRPILL